MKTFQLLFLAAIMSVAGIAIAQTPPGGNAMPGDPHAQTSDKPVESMGSIKRTKVFFISPKDGQTVKKEFEMKFGVEGMKVKPAGEVVPGTGHFHVVVDSPAIAEGQVIGNDAQHIHYGKGQMEAKLKLPPGEHTLTLQFADGAHRAYGSMLNQTIKIKVK